MPPGIQIRLLGPFEARRADGTPLPAPGRQSVALLACLTLRDDTTGARQGMAELIWHGRGAEQANGSLRQELLRLRRAFGPEIALPVSDGPARSPRLDDERFDVDVLRFNRAAQSQAGAAEAIALYRGPLLEGFPTREREPFTEWLLRQRRVIHDMAVSTLVRTLRSAEASEAAAERLLALDPVCEEAFRFLIRCHAVRGDLGRVQACYRRCAMALASRLDQTPSHETRALVQRAEAELQAGTVNAFMPDPAAETAEWIRGLRRRPNQASPPQARLHPIIADRPSIVVLPFTDLSGDHSRDGGAFADAMTEEATNALARVPGFFVTARHSAMVYRGVSMDVRRIAGELGVRYLLEGSLEFSQHRLRSNVRLIDGGTGFHIWAETIEVSAGDPLGMRDRIVHEAVARIQPRLMLAESRRTPEVPASDITAWTWTMRANVELAQPREAAETLRGATAALKQALVADPNYAMAHALLGSVYTYQSLAELNISGLRGRQRARHHMDLALRYEPDNALVLSACAETALYAAGDLDHAQALLERAIALNPNDANVLALLGNVRRMVGDDPRSALALIEQAMRISPRDPRSSLWLQYGAWCHWKAGEFEGMQVWARESAELHAGNPFAWVALTCALGLGGREAEARETAKIVREMMPSFSPTKFYWLARLMYGRRFPGATREGYRRLRDVLQQANQ